MNGVIFTRPYPALEVSLAASLKHVKDRSLNSKCQGHPRTTSLLHFVGLVMPVGVGG